MTALTAETAELLLRFRSDCSNRRDCHWDSAVTTETAETVPGFRSDRGDRRAQRDCHCDSPVTAATAETAETVAGISVVTVQMSRAERQWDAYPPTVTTFPPQTAGTVVCSQLRISGTCRSPDKTNPSLKGQNVPSTERRSRSRRHAIRRPCQGGTP